MHTKTIDVMDLVTKYDDVGFQDRICYYTYPETLFPRAGERIVEFLNTQPRPVGVLGNYYDALTIFGGGDVVTKVINTDVKEAYKLPQKDRNTRDMILEILRLWFTEEVKQQSGDKPIKLWIRVGTESWKYKLAR